MNTFLKSILDKTWESVEHTTQAITQKIEAMLKEPSFSIEELASFVAAHEYTNFNQRSLLGITFHFYELKLNDLTFYLETKGESGSYILELLITNSTNTLVQYYSYQHKSNPTKAVKLTDQITQMMK
ncbi:hypothetical protein [Bacillus sp. PS06]|uniref:hypothetical protein n=1 Tax=Bacillus sp. PS06 TaxID=2764176 RepID=UPI00177C5F9E|nr:hypothetical protein [Bacillus sp. PS06]MBD8067747.1 hypothetical protein [Bacillus sp. PS06]